MVVFGVHLFVSGAKLKFNESLGNLVHYYEVVFVCVSIAPTSVCVNFVFHYRANRRLRARSKFRDKT